MFGVADYGAFVAAFILLLFIPGPGNLALISSTAKGGLAGGTGSVLGLLVGDQVLMWLTVAGVAAVLVANPGLFAILQMLGAAYLAWLGLHMLLAKPGAPSLIDIKAGQYFRQTLVITLFNPKAIFFYVAFFPQFIDPATHRGLATFAFMAATVAVLGFVYCMGVVLLTHYLATRIRSHPVISAGLNKLAGIFLIGFGIKLALSK